MNDIILQKGLKNLIVTEVSTSAYDFISIYNNEGADSTLFISTNNIFNILKEEENKYKTIVNFERSNDIKRLNKYFKAVNSRLPEGGSYVGCVETYLLRKKRILAKYPKGLNWIYYFFDFIIKRVFPKFSITKKIYFAITSGRNRVLSKAETYGRLYSCGFKFLAEKNINGRLYFVFSKTKDPILDQNPSYGPLFKMRRIGKNNKVIYCYKLRTMHAYSEFLQEYIYEKNNLAEGGKFKEDFRVTTMGRLFRKFWIDELPMIINLLRGDLKIVGVRPLSQHYLSLYSTELIELRSRHKPGLIPPFYADMPSSLEEIMDSEIKYLRLFEKRPFWTDLKYFVLAFKNILFKNARSK